MGALREALDNLVCKCGHRDRQHDPEDGDCEAGVHLGKCPCRAFSSPDPDKTVNELRIDALFADAAGLVDALIQTGVLEHVGWHCTYDDPGRFPSERPATWMGELGGHYRNDIVREPVYRLVGVEEKA